MKAMLFDQFGGPEQLVLRDIPSPSCGPDEILIDIYAASVTPGDWKLRAGLLQAVFPVSLPCIPGRDGAGVVVEVGANVNAIKVGDLVCFVADRLVQGSYAEQIACSIDQVALLPRGFSFAQAAALVHAAMCAWIMLVDYAQIKRDQHVLIHAGSGAIGSMAIQLARFLGAQITTTCSSKNRNYVQSLGAHQIVLYDKENFADVVTDVDVVLDLIGGEVHELSRKVLKPGGLLVWLLGLPFSPLIESQYPIRESMAVINDSPEVLRAVVDLASKGILTPQVSQVLPLAEAANAHALIESSSHGRGRLVLDIIGEASHIPYK